MEENVYDDIVDYIIEEFVLTCEEAKGQAIEIWQNGTREDFDNFIFSILEDD